MNDKDSKHTPGPWRIEVSKNWGTRIFATVDGNVFEICAGVGGQVYKGDDGKYSDRSEIKANASLMKASPDLLEALRECLECEFPVTDKAAIAKAIAAIAKAAGGQP